LKRILSLFSWVWRCSSQCYAIMGLVCAVTIPYSTVLYRFHHPLWASLPVSCLLHLTVVV
jgi:membrane protein YdbS with pleckstrin-like domain